MHGEGCSETQPLRAVLFVTGDSHRSLANDRFVPAWGIKSVAREKEPYLDLSFYTMTFRMPPSWRVMLEMEAKDDEDLSGLPTGDELGLSQSKAGSKAAQKSQFDLELNAPCYRCSNESRLKIDPQTEYAESLICKWAVRHVFVSKS